MRNRYYVCYQICGVSWSWRQGNGKEILRKGESMKLTLPIQVDRTWNKKEMNAAGGWKIQGEALEIEEDGEEIETLLSHLGLSYLGAMLFSLMSEVIGNGDQFLYIYTYIHLY